MTDLARALWTVAAIFESLDAPYAVMGGIAVRMYAIPRPTYDVDFTVALSPGSLPKVFEKATAAGFTVPEPYLQGWVDETGGMKLVKLRMYLENQGIDIDIFLAESAFQESLLARRREEDLEGESVWFVSPEDLVLLKLIAGRPRDMVDVQDVLFTQGQLDESYLRHWAMELNVLDRWEQLRGGD